MEQRVIGAEVKSGGVRLIRDLRGQLMAGGNYENQEARAARMYSIIESRKDEVTMTLLLMMPPGDPIAYLLNNSLLGMRYNADSQRDEMHAADPLHPAIHLQSLRMKCPACEAGSCGRVGKYHDVTYRAGTKSGTGAELNLIVAMGGTADINVLCEVDPETGHFVLPPFEAKMALRQWGEHALKATRRYPGKDPTKGDRWKIRELSHYEQYGNATLDGVVDKDVPAMGAD